MLLPLPAMLLPLPAMLLPLPLLPLLPLFQHPGTLYLIQDHCYHFVQITYYFFHSRSHGTFHPIALLSATPTATAPSPTPPLLSAADLARAFASTSAPSSSSMSHNAMFNRHPTELTQVLTAEAVLATGVLADPTVRDGLLQLLPEGQQTERYLEINLRSPQFQQALDALGSALSSENFNSVMANLGIDPAPGSNWLVRDAMMWSSPIDMN